MTKLEHTRAQLSRMLLATPVLVALLVVIFTYSNWGRWIGTVYPVAGPIIERSFVIEELEIRPGWSRVTFTLDKHRDCRYRAMAIYWEDADGVISRVPWDNLVSDRATATGDQNRPVGRNRVTVDVNTQLPPDRWEIKTLHDCHPLLPPVLTTVWP